MTDSVRDDIERAAARTPTEDKATATYWAEEMATVCRQHTDWHLRGDKIIDRYLDERGEKTDRDFVRAQHRMNILWSNVQTLLPTLIAHTPTPNVARANKDKDPVGRYAAMVLQRCIAAQLRSDDFLQSLKSTVLDLLLPGRGVCFVIYDSDIEEAELDDDGNELAPETVTGQRCRLEYWHWKNFYTNRARHWGEVWFIVKESFLDRDELRERYGKELADKVPLDHKPDTDKGSKIESEQFNKATIYQIWDSRAKKIIEMAKEYKEAPLAVRDPPVTFDNFWPCPRPLFATIGGTSMLPVADYVQYQDQAEEIDQMTNRIHGLTKALRLRGIYDSSFAALGQIFNDASDNELVPVDSYALLSEKGGLSGVLAFVPLKDVAAALMECMRARDDAKKTMYEVTGISDIVRGATKASETATAQQLKSQWGSIRIRERQQDVARFARDLIRLMSEIIAEHFTQKTLAEMSNVKLLTAQEKAAIQQWQAMQAQRAQQVQAMSAQQGQPVGMPPPSPPPFPPDQLALMAEPSWDDVVGLLRNERLRSFVIDVETDSTIEPDQQQERQDRTAFVTAVTQYMMAAEKILGAAPNMAPLMGELLLFAVRGWKVGEQMETKIEEAVEQMEKLAQQPKQPDPKAVADAEKSKADMAAIQADSQNEQLKAATEEKKIQQEAASDAGWQQVESEKVRDNLAERDFEAREAELNRRHESEMAEFTRQTEEAKARRQAAGQAAE